MLTNSLGKMLASRRTETVSPNILLCRKKRRKRMYEYFVRNLMKLSVAVFHFEIHF